MDINLPHLPKPQVLTNRLGEVHYSEEQMLEYGRECITLTVQHFQPVEVETPIAESPCTVTWAAEDNHRLDVALHNMYGTPHPGPAPMDDILEDVWTKISDWHGLLDYFQDGDHQRVKQAEADITRSIKNTIYEARRDERGKTNLETINTTVDAMTIQRDAYEAKIAANGVFGKLDQTGEEPTWTQEQIDQIQSDAAELRAKMVEAPLADPDFVDPITTASFSDHIRWIRNGLHRGHGHDDIAIGNMKKWHNTKVAEAATKREKLIPMYQLSNDVYDPPLWIDVDLTTYAAAKNAGKIGRVLWSTSHEDT